jgi:tyrosine-protein kinase Etk/Wzc
MATEISQPKLQNTAERSNSPRYDKEKVSLLDVLILLAEQKKIILLVTVAFTIVAVLVSLLIPARYTASVTILPPAQGNSLAAAFTSQLGGSLGGMAALAGGGLGLKNPNDMLVAMLQSRVVEDAVVQRFGLMQEYHSRYLSDARKAFENHVIVKGNGLDGLIHLSVEDASADRAEKIANGYIEQFRELSAHLAIGEAAQRRLFFEQQLEQAKENLANAEEALQRTQQKTGLIQLDSQTRALIQSAASLRAQIVATEVQIQSMRTFATDENANLIQAQEELNGLRSQLAELTRTGGGKDEGLIIPKGQMSEAGLEYVRKLRDVKYFETIFDILARQFEMAKLDEARQGALIQVVDPAIVPDKRSFPKRSLIVFGAMVCGFIFGIFWALFQAGLERARSNSEVIEKLSALRRAVVPQRKTV